MSLQALVQIQLSAVRIGAKIYCLVRLHASVCVIKVSVPVSEVVGVEEGRVEILPKKSVEGTDKDFTGGLSFRGANSSKKSRLHPVFVQLEGFLILYNLFEIKQACETCDDIGDTVILWM